MDEAQKQAATGAVTVVVGAAAFILSFMPPHWQWLLALAGGSLVALGCLLIWE